MNFINSIKNEVINRSDVIKKQEELAIVTNEINNYIGIAEKSIYEVGKRLKYVKQNLIEKGEWEKYCQNIVRLNSQYANRFIKVFEEFGENLKTKNLPFETLYVMASLPAEEREKSHIIPSTGDEKKIEDMSRPEMREVKKFLTNSQTKRKEVENDLIEEGLIEKFTTSNNVTVKVIDDEKVNHLKLEVNQLKRRLLKEESERKLLEVKLKEEERDAEKHRKLKKDLDMLNDRKDNVIKQIANAETIGEFIHKIEKSLQDDLAPLKYCRAMEELEYNKAVKKALDKIVTMVETWCKEIRSLMPSEENIRKNIN